MTYELNYGGEIVELPAYNFDIADKLEKQETINSGTAKFRDKCKSMYELIRSLTGEEFVSKVIGNFNKADPNEINIVYMKIVRVYSSPLNEYNEDSLNQVDYSKIDKVVEIINALDKARNIKL